MGGEVAVAQDVADLVALQEVPPLLLSSQAPGLGPIMEEEAPMGDLPMEGLRTEGLLMEEALMEGLHMEGDLLLEGGPMVLTPLGLLVLCVADNHSSTRIRFGLFGITIWHYYLLNHLANQVLDNLYEQFYRR